MKWNGLITKHHKSQIRKLWTTSDHWAWQPSINCIESFVTFFLTGNSCLCLSTHHRLALVINGHHTWSFQLFDLPMKHNLFQQCLQQEAILKSCLFPSWRITSCEHPPTGTTSQNWIEKDHSEIMLSECKNAPQPETEPTQKFPYKASISDKNIFALLLLYRSNKVLQHSLVCESWEWQRVTDWENLFQNPSPYEAHACMNSPVPLVWNPSLNPLLWNPWIHWYAILESTDVKSLNPPIWILDTWCSIWRETNWTRRRRRNRRRRSSISCMRHSIAQKLQPNSSRAICPPPPSLRPFFLPLLDAKPQMKLLLQLVTEMHIQHLVANKTKQASQQLQKQTDQIEEASKKASTWIRHRHTDSVWWVCRV